MSFATTCWNCGSKNFQETVSREYCPDCKIECNYHGSGTNEEYRKASDAIHERERRARFDRELEKEMEEERLHRLNRDY